MVKSTRRYSKVSIVRRYFENILSDMDTMNLLCCYSEKYVKKDEIVDGNIFTQNGVAHR